MVEKLDWKILVAAAGHCMYVVAGNSFEVVHISDDENLDYRPVDSFLYGDLEKTINH